MSLRQRKQNKQCKGIFGGDTGILFVFVDSHAFSSYALRTFKRKPNSGNFFRTETKRLEQNLTFTTQAYNDEALKVIICEANRLANDLKLNENLSIKNEDLVDRYISPPRLAQGSETIGNIATNNYSYYPFSGRKISIVKRNNEKEFKELKKKYVISVNQIDTNAAVEVALQFLKAIPVDMKRLNQDCNLQALPSANDGKYFLRLLGEQRTKFNRQYCRGRSFLPSRSLRQLYVKESKYILRKSVTITNTPFFLSQTKPYASTIDLKAQSISNSPR